MLTPAAASVKVWPTAKPASKKLEGVVDAVAFVRGEPQVAALLTPDAAGHTQAAVVGGARSLLELCADYVRPHFGAAQRDGALRADITVEGAVEFSRGNRDRLQGAEHIGEPEPHEADLALLEGAKHELLLAVHGSPLSPTHVSAG